MTTADMVIFEADKYFERNQEKFDDSCDASKGTYLVADFIKKFNTSRPDAIKNFCEIGCNYGYNLFYLSRELRLNCSGVEASPKAVKYGIDKMSEYSSVGGCTSVTRLIQQTSL